MTRIGSSAVAIGLCLVIIARGLGSLGDDVVRGRVGDVVLRVAPVAAVDGRLRPGDDVSVRFRMHAEHGASDRLVAVRSDLVSRLEMRWDRDCDGTAEQVAALPLEHGVVPADGTGSDYRVVLVDLREERAVGSTVTVEFDFARAGELTVAVPVAAAAAEPVGCSDPDVR